MNREIKFRVWNGVFMAPVAQLLGCHGWDSQGKTTWNFAHKESKSDHWKEILLQFTGFLDAENKEIYEGDIIKGRSGKVQGLRMVIFQEGRFVAKTLDQRSMDDLHEAFDREDSHIVVVGNIFESQDLPR